MAAEQVNAPKKKLVLDVPTRWNSTYMMLSVAYEFRDAFERLPCFDRDFKSPPSYEEWENVRAAKDCLELFYRITKRFSGSKYPTANLYFNDVCLIHSSLKKWMLDSRPFIVSMADKHFDNVRAAFVTLYGAYLEEERNTSAENRQNRSSIGLESGESVSISGLESTPSSTRDAEFLELDLWLKESNTNKTEKTDCQLYFELPVLTNYSPNFDILAWWRDEEGKFPILAKIARDILSIPVSTVASESAFSTGGRILDSYRSSLKPSTVESLVCCQDWIKNASKGSPNSLGTIPLAPKVDAEDVAEEDVILPPPSYFNDDEDDELEHNFTWFWNPDLI